MLVDFELNKLNFIIANALYDKSNNVSDDIIDYLAAKSKRLRPALIFLFAKALGFEITDSIYSLACAVELVHNSALIHDDILDNAQTRRGKLSLNCKLGTNLSVLSGDILLASALKQLIKCDNMPVLNVFSESLYNMCKGEINQHFTLERIPSMEEYIKKTEFKTAELFKAPLLSLFYILNIPQYNNIKDFSYNFGIAFQIKDDLMNIMNSDETKPALSDIQNGIFTAPVIFLNEDVKIIGLSKDKITTLAQDKRYIDKTVNLIKEYADKAISAIDFIPENEYKKEIVEKTQNLYKADKNG